MKKEKESCDRFAIAPQAAKVSATICEKCLVKIEKVLNLWMEDMPRKPFPTESNVLHQQVTSPHKDFSKGTPEISDTKPLTANTVTKIQEQIWTEKYKNYGRGCICQ